MIGVLGISHRSAPLEIREKFSISKPETGVLGEKILKETEVTEVVIVSTCNRTEIYFYHKKSCIKKTEKQLKSILHGFKQVNNDYTNHFYSFSNYDAADHLFSVTSGLKSMVFGEDQIVSQIKEAYLHCTNLTFTDAVLMRLFQKSFETGKKVRTETNIQKGATSVAYVAVEQCQELMQGFKDKEILLIGTGDTGRMVVQKMVKMGVRNLSFSNRTFEKAMQLADDYNGKLINYDTVKSKLSDFDIIVTATSAGSIIIDKLDVESACSNNNKHQVYVDLSVPRNIDPAIAECENTTLLSVDSLQPFIEKTAALRKACKEEAEYIVSDMVKDFFSWYDSRALRPVIQAITNNMQNLQKSELEKYRKQFPDETFQAVDEYSSRLTQKYIRSIIKKLRELNENGEVAHSLTTINNLFEFEPKEQQ